MEKCPELHGTQLLSEVVEPVVQKEPSAQEAASALAQFAQAVLLLAENVPSLHGTQLLSTVVEPAVQKDPLSQSVAKACFHSSQLLAPVAVYVLASQSEHKPADVALSPVSRMVPFACVPQVV